MNRDEFDKILIKSGVNPYYFDKCWINWIEYTKNFPLGDHYHSLQFYASNAISKGYASAPL